MNSAIKLAQMGCGSEIVNSCIDRGNIHAAIYNCNTFLSYYKDAVKSGLYTKENAVLGLMPYYNKLLSVEHLANTYHYLWLDKYSKMKLKTEKFINN